MRVHAKWIVAFSALGILTVALLGLVGLLANDMLRLETSNSPLTPLNEGIVTAISTNVLAMATAILGIVTVGAVAAAILAGMYADNQLAALKDQSETSIKIARGEFLLHIDEMLLRYHRGIYLRLYPGDPSLLAFPRDYPAMVMYMGLFERIKRLCDDRILDIGLINKLYGYRIDDIIANPTVYQELVRDMCYGWVDFISLWVELEKWRHPDQRFSERMLEFRDYLEKVDPENLHIDSQANRVVEEIRRFVLSAIPAPVVNR
jgi:hypothetical protein